MSSQEPVAPHEPARPTKRSKNAQLDPKGALEVILLNAHRISASISSIKAFADAGVTVAEWEILRTIGNRNDVPLRQLIAASGLSRQRIRKVLSDLQARRLLAGNRASGEDKRARTISATPGTARALASISAQLEKLLADTGQGNQGRKLAVAARTMSRLARQLRLRPLKDGPKKKFGKAMQDEKI